MEMVRLVLLSLFCLSSLAAAEVPRIRFHDLRHRAASLLICAGRAAAHHHGPAGHSSIAVTANVYAHLPPELIRDAADKMEAILGA